MIKSRNSEDIEIPNIMKENVLDSTNNVDEDENLINEDEILANEFEDSAYEDELESENSLVKYLKNFKANTIDQIISDKSEYSE